MSHRLCLGLDDSGTYAALRLRFVIQCRAFIYLICNHLWCFSCTGYEPRGREFESLRAHHTIKELGHFFGGLFLFRRENVSTSHDPKTAPTIYPLCQMLGRKMRIPLHHLCRSPSAKFLQHIQRRPVLCMPACPGMPQIMPPETGCDASTFYCFPPCIRRGLNDGLAMVGEHPG